MNRKVIRTADGSKTIELTELGETYHSRHGALVEAQHVFIEAGLRFWLNANSSLTAIEIFEMGLGTGMNAILTFDQIKSLNLSCHYHAIEAFPIASEELAELETVTWGSEDSVRAVHDSSWGEVSQATPTCTLLKQVIKWEDFESQTQFDVIYFDAFGARTQPELWSDDQFIKCAQLLKPGGVFVTYSSKGSVRRALQSADLKVEKIPGPPGKREMLRAIKPNADV